MIIRFPLEVPKVFPKNEKLYFLIGNSDFLLFYYNELIYITQQVHDYLIFRTSLHNSFFTFLIRKI